MGTTKLICLGHTDKLLKAYNSWFTMHRRIETVPIDIRGQADWKTSDLKTTENVYLEFANHIEEPYCVFVYGLGSMIVGELMQQLVKNNIALPIYIFISEDIPPSDNTIEVKATNNKERNILSQEKQSMQMLDINMSVFYSKQSNRVDLGWRKCANKKYTEYAFEKIESNSYMQEELESVISSIISRELVTRRLQQSFKIIL